VENPFPRNKKETTFDRIVCSAFSILHSPVAALPSCCLNIITMPRKKSLLIGINYTGSQNELRGCHQDVENIAEFLSYRGFSSDPRSQVILRDDAPGQYSPTGHNMLVGSTHQQPCDIY
jgi:hypothetical protein